MAFWNDPTNLIPKQKHRWVISFGARDKQASFDGTAASLDDNTMHMFLAKSVDRPSYTIKTVSAKYLYSHTFKFPTRPVWNPITITLYDAQVADDVRTYFSNPIISGDGARITNKAIGTVNEEKMLFKQSTQFFFYDFLRQSGYYDPEEYDADDQLLRFRSYNFKRNMIESLVGNKDSNLEYAVANGEAINTQNFWNYFTIREYSADGILQENWEIYNPLITDVKFDKLDYSSDDIPLITATIEYDWAAMRPMAYKVKDVDLYIKEQAAKREQLYKDASKEVDLLLKENLGQGFTLQQAELAKALIEEDLKQKLAFLDKKTIGELAPEIERTIKKSTNITDTIGDYQASSQSAVPKLESKALQKFEDSLDVLGVLKAASDQSVISLSSENLKKISPENIAEFSKKTGISITDIEEKISEEKFLLKERKASAEGQIKDQDRKTMLISGFEQVAQQASANRVTGDSAAVEGARAAIRAINETLNDKRYKDVLSESDKAILAKEKNKYLAQLQRDVSSRQLRPSETSETTRAVLETSTDVVVAEAFAEENQPQGLRARGKVAADWQEQAMTARTIAAFQANPQSFEMFETQPVYIYEDVEGINANVLRSIGVQPQLNLGSNPFDILEYLPNKESE